MISLFFSFAKHFYDLFLAWCCRYWKISWGSQAVWVVFTVVNIITASIIYLVKYTKYFLNVIISVSLYSCISVKWFKFVLMVASLCINLMFEIQNLGFLTVHVVISEFLYTKVGGFIK